MTQTKREWNTASISTAHFCSACGWPVVTACCNDAMSKSLPFSDYDWWAYCANKACVNHVGEGFYQEKPEFVEER